MAIFPGMAAGGGGEGERFVRVGCVVGCVGGGGGRAEGGKLVPRGVGGGYRGRGAPRHRCVGGLATSAGGWGGLR